MAKPLTAENLAIVCAMRAEGATVNECAKAIHRDYRPVSAALAAAGLDTSRLAKAIGTPELRKRAHQLYMVDGLSLRKVATEMGIRLRVVRAWIVDEGGEIRPGNTGVLPGETPKGKRQHVARKPSTRWGAGVKCAIGGVKSKGRPSLPVGSYYCSEHCDWTNCQSVKPCEFLHGISRQCLREDIPCDARVDMCDAEVTEENRRGFAEFKARRAEDARKIAGDKKYKVPHRSKAEEQAVLARAMRGERDE